MTKGSSTVPADDWFIADRAITTEEADKFSHASVAQVLVEAIRNAKPPATIGLLGGFGTGKTSVAELTKARLKGSSEFDVVHVSADKHSGQARSRNIVHSVAGELALVGDIDESDVIENLRPLTMSINVNVPAPERTPLIEAILGKRSPRDLVLVGAFTLAVIGFFIWISVAVNNEPLRQVATLASILPVLALLGKAFWDANDSIVRSWFKAATRQESTPRAEAADEVERVFADLVRLHRKRRKDRQLVIFVDDVDRLGPGDVLDALRAIKSLQAVPKGDEPIFVVSCDEDIVLEALRSATLVSTTAEAIDQQAGLASERAGSAEAATAFLDKFFTVRIPLPPHIPTDMMAFVRTLLPQAHPLRATLGDELDTVLLMLARGEVSDPRHMIRRVNAFLTQYRLAERREQQSNPRLHPGDATSRPRVMARLAVLAADFANFYARLRDDESLLRLADRLLLNIPLTPEQRSVLTFHKLAEEDEDGSLTWTGSAALRAYLVGTARHVQADDGSLVPLIFLSDTEGGRILGNKRVERLLSASRSGDADTVVEDLSQIDPDAHRVVADALADELREAHEVELLDLISGVAPAIPHLNEGAEEVADAAAYAAQRCDAAEIDPDILRTLLDHAGAGHEDALLRSLSTVGAESEAQDADRRMRVAATYLVDRPGANHLPAAIATHLASLHTSGGWTAFGPSWLALAGQLHSPIYRELIDGSVLPCLLKLIADDAEYNHEEHGGPLLALLSDVMDQAKPALRKLLGQGSSRTTSHYHLAIEGFEKVGVADADTALLLAQAAEEGGVPMNERARAIRLIAGSTAAWQNIKLKKKDPDDDDDPPRYVRDTIARRLVNAGKEDDALMAELSTQLGALAPVRAVVDALVEEAALLVEESSGNGETPPAGGQLLVGALLKHLDAASEPDQFVDRILAVLIKPSEQSDATRYAIDLIASVAEAVGGDGHLTRAAATWQSAVVNDASPFDRPVQLEAFRRLDALLPTMASSGIAPAAGQLTPRVQTVVGVDLTATLHLMCHLPWGAGEASGVMDAVAPHLDALVNTGDAIVLASRGARLGHQVPAALLVRSVDSVQADPTGQHVALVRDLWSQFDANQRAHILHVGCGRNSKIDELCSAMASDEVIDLLSILSPGRDISAVVAAIDAGSRSEIVTEVLRRLAGKGATVDPNWATGAMTQLSETERLQVARASLASAGDGLAGDLAALRIVHQAVGKAPEEFLADVQAFAMAHLPETATVESAELLDGLLAGRLTKDLKAVLKDLLGDDDRRAVGLAIRDK